MGRDGSGRKRRGRMVVLWSPKTSLKYTLVKGAILHREPSLLSTIALLFLKVGILDHSLTDRQKLTAKINLYGMSSFHFHCWNQFEVIPLVCTLRTTKRTYPRPHQFRCWWSDADYTLWDISVITRWRHKLYTYSKWELLGLFRLQ